MPRSQKEPGGLRAPKSWDLRGKESVASSLHLVGPDKGSILEFFELISV